MPRALAGLLFAVILVPLLTATNALAQSKAPDKAAIDKAIAAGVKFLRQLPTRDGTWIYEVEEPEFGLGASLLGGIALLENGVEKNDPWLQNLAKAVRAAGGYMQKTYSLGLAVLFLDRLGDDQDAELVRVLALRIAGGQDRITGGWGYDCKPLNPMQQKQLEEFLKKNRGPFKFAKGRPDTRHVRPGREADNSNTQFAVLALWVARKRSIPVEFPLLLAAWRFRATQIKDGGWGYGRDLSVDPAGTPAMTCSGLLALAIGFGTYKEHQAHQKASGTPETPSEGYTQPLDIRGDAAVTAAKAFLAKRLASQDLPGGQPFYFLWSLERVAMLYGFTDIGGGDWYAFGSDFLVRTQKPDGSWWSKDNGGIVDTCFALLFLKKANLIKDLTEDISGVASLGVIENPEKALKDPAPPMTTKPAAALKEVTPAEAESVATKLATELKTAKDARFAELLDAFQNTVDRTGNFTAKLAEVIPQLPAGTQPKAREALAARLARQTAKSLQSKLADREEDRETRLAVVRAVALKKEKTLTPDLIEVLGDKDPAVAGAAEAALKELTGQELGRQAEPWRTWWKTQK
jgi:hypothetical protein